MSVGTERALLRRFRPGDLARMRELETDAEVMKWTPSRVPQSAEQSEARLHRLLAREAEWAPLGVWAAESRSDGDFLGWFMLLKAEFDAPELGFMLVRRHWGEGFAAEIGRALVNYAANLGSSGLAAVTDEGNLASTRVLEKLGFRLEGYREKADPLLKRTVRALIYRRP